MARHIKPEDAITILAELFRLAENDYRDSAPLKINPKLIAKTDRLFSSATQAYREALVGCAVARIMDPEIDIRFPATAGGENSFSGRSLADHAITPFFKEKSVPVSASPYLSSLRGGAKFIPGGQPRIQRDPEGFNALVSIVNQLRRMDPEKVREYLRYLLRRFIELREDSNISLKRFAKPTLEQLKLLIDGLLRIKSGGRIPCFLTVAMFQALSECHKLGWNVDFQGINVADKFTGAVGDITIKKDGSIILGVEVTERPITKARVLTVFDEKVSPTSLAEYLFVSTAPPDEGAVMAARNYTAVGHEMNFVNLISWIFENLATIGASRRKIFQDKLISQLAGTEVPAEYKIAWNELMEETVGHTKK